VTLGSCDDDYRSAQPCDGAGQAACDDTGGADGGDAGTVDDKLEEGQACDAADNWEPASLALDVETLKPDTGEPIVLTVEFESDTAGAGLRARVCKQAGSTFLNDAIAVRIETSDHASSFHDAELHGPGERCTGWGTLDGVEAFGAGDSLDVRTRIVSPSACSAMWDPDCATSPEVGCGFCWRTEEVHMARTCR